MSENAPGIQKILSRFGLPVTLRFSADVHQEGLHITH